MASQYAVKTTATQPDTDPTTLVNGSMIIEAAQRLEKAIINTAFTHSPTLSELAGAEIYLKFENLQRYGSFKERGARNRLAALVESGETVNGVIAMSAGNHAQGVAFHARELGIPATIVMPEGTPFVKVSRTRDLGATVKLIGADVEQAAAAAERIALEQDLVFVHPFDDPLVIAGQGTVAREMLDEQPDLDLIVCPIGGGGLCSGVATEVSAHNELNNTDIKVLGVQTERYPSMADTLANRASTAKSGSTVADGIAVSQAGKLTRQILAKHNTPVVVVDELAIEECIALLTEFEKTVVEGAGAAALAACLRFPRKVANRKVGVILSGGNIDPRTFAVVTLRGLANQGRLNRLRVELDDVPGRLALVSDLIADQRANVIQVDHDGLGSTGARSAILELRIETLDQAHANAVLQSLIDAGLAAQLVGW